MNREPLRALKRVALRPSTARIEWELDLLGRRPRRQPGTERVTGFELEYVDGASFVSAYRSIFLDRIYDLPAGVHRPRIVDGGANIGLAVARWVTRHPGSLVHAFEADPDIARVLRENVARVPGTADVTVTEAALWSENTTVHFAATGDDAGRVATDTPPSRARRVAVRALPLAPVLEEMESVDLLKLDIEGDETSVLLAAADQLHRVDRLFVEYHSATASSQALADLLALVRDVGMRIQVHEEFVSPRPFLEVHDDHGMDLRLNIFAQRRRPGG